ncbi:hypothetical protein BH23CHL2_BH23CHL2_03480 [soil metagenome]
MYDLIIVGGGIAGSTLAMVMAQTGAAVLILEREECFRDRIRGEGVHVWGTVDANELGVRDILLNHCAHELTSVTRYSDESIEVQRNLVETTPSGGRELTFFHPDMQETLVQAAHDAGAEVWRGAGVSDVQPGDPPTIQVAHSGDRHQLSARLVVGADGRRSRVRNWTGFETRRDPNNMLIAGALVSGIPADTHSLQVFSSPGAAWNTQFLPLGNGSYRCYFVTGDRCRHTPIGGIAGIKKLFEYARDSRVPRSWLDEMSITGPLASFESASWWVDHPYRDGVALIGDAAAAPDPCFGSGLSMALRDVRLLRDRLLADSDWNRAATGYAEAHDTTFAALHRLECWVSEGYYSVAPEKEHIREHAESALKQGDAPDLVGRGPDQPSDEAARLRFLGY